MGKAIEQREALIDQIDDVKVLQERLKAAEAVCIMFAWDAAPDRKWERGRLQMKFWTAWHAIAGGMDSTHPKANAELHEALEDADRRDREFKKAQS